MTKKKQSFIYAVGLLVVTLMVSTDSWVWAHDHGKEWQVKNRATNKVLESEIEGLKLVRGIDLLKGSIERSKQHRRDILIKYGEDHIFYLEIMDELELKQRRLDEHLRELEKISALTFEHTKERLRIAQKYDD